MCKCGRVHSLESFHVILLKGSEDRTHDLPETQIPSPVAHAISPWYYSQHWHPYMIPPRTRTWLLRPYCRSYFSCPPKRTPAPEASSIWLLRIIVPSPRLPMPVFRTIHVGPHTPFDLAFLALRITLKCSISYIELSYNSTSLRYHQLQSFIMILNTYWQGVRWHFVLAILLLFNLRNDGPTRKLFRQWSMRAPPLVVTNGQQQTFKLFRNAAIYEPRSKNWMYWVPCTVVGLAAKRNYEPGTL